MRRRCWFSGPTLTSACNASRSWSIRFGPTPTRTAKFSTCCVQADDGSDVASLWHLAPRPGLQHAFVLVHILAEAVTCPFT
jgi:hypothetical protein